MKTVPVSIVIPTLNEEKLLPRLLQSIKEQTVQPLEVIVADNNSEDNTRKIAKQYKARIIKGGVLAVGRNNGGKKAKGKLIFFMDADGMMSHPDFLKNVYEKFTKSGADVGSTLFMLDKESKKDPLCWFIFLFYQDIKKSNLKKSRPTIEGGFCLIAKKKAFDKLKGFSILPQGVPEDLEFMCRAVDSGYKYKVINEKVYTSGRRYHTLPKAVRSLIGVALQGTISEHNLWNDKKLLKLTSLIYGQLGNKPKKPRKKPSL